SDILEAEATHGGWNMYEELCWLNLLMEEKKYTPNMGRRYFAELANPVPRAIWPDKPLIGIDYAIARGQSFEGAGEGQAGVGATISTGMIGQGVDNFGTVFGPPSAALLMAIWIVLLARIDLHVRSAAGVPLYILGLVLTFNLGRDITFLVAYPFFFGLLAIKVVDLFKSSSNMNRKRTTE
ncbi:MAG: hypothetical protein AAF456_04215, partial [Planctomycetota bacterium]